jgi:peptidoglycan/LPS O-acetylase OafA/YrhL
VGAAAHHGRQLLIAAGPQAWCNRYVLAQPRWCGRLISYPLYLWHWPLLSFAHILHSAQPAWQVRGVAVLLAVLLAWLTYRLLEQRAHARP